MAKSDETAQFRANLQAEIDGAALYRALADAETDSHPQRAAIYRELAGREEEHARLWQTRLKESGEHVPQMRPGWRPRVLGWLAKRFGPGLVLPTIANMEQVDSDRYDAQADARLAGLPADERSHARLIRVLASRQEGIAGGDVAQLEGRHRAVGGNALRAAVLGANDGLVSNLSLVMGVAGAALPVNAILITGLAGLMAGAGSMAMGEWLSVQSSRELYQRQIAIERSELEHDPDSEAEELALIYRAKGVAEEEAYRIARQIVQDKETALDTLAREELGVDPEELGGSAWQAAGASFVLFAVGAIVPVLPYFFLVGAGAVITSVAASTLALFLIGAGITLMTGRGLLFSGMRQVLFGLGAAALTFAVGRLIGVAIAG